jgi:hypothetical protein
VFRPKLRDRHVERGGDGSGGQLARTVNAALKICDGRASDASSVGKVGLTPSASESVNGKWGAVRASHAVQFSTVRGGLTV